MQDYSFKCNTPRYLDYRLRGEVLFCYCALFFPLACVQRKCIGQTMERKKNSWFGFEEEKSGKYGKRRQTNEKEKIITQAIEQKCVNYWKYRNNKLIHSEEGK